MPSLRLLIINASARKYGNTAKMAFVAKMAAELHGAATRLIHLYDYRVERCMACYSDNPLECHYPKKCPLYQGVDDYRRLADMILSSDAVVFATPVYWFNVTGALKNLIDRMTSLENMVHHTGRSLLDGKVGGALAAGEEAGAALALSWLAFTLNMMGMHIPAWGTAYYHGRGDVLFDEQAVLDSYNVGRSVALAAAVLIRGEAPPAEWYVRPPREQLDELRAKAAEEAERLQRLQEATRPWLGPRYMDR